MWPHVHLCVHRYVTSRNSTTAEAFPLGLGSRDVRSVVLMRWRLSMAPRQIHLDEVGSASLHRPWLPLLLIPVQQERGDRHARAER